MINFDNSFLKNDAKYVVLKYYLTGANKYFKMTQITGDSHTDRMGDGPTCMWKVLFSAVFTLQAFSERFYFCSDLHLTETRILIRVS